MKKIKELAAKIEEVSNQRDHLVDLRISDKGGYWQVEVNGIGRKYMLSGDNLGETLEKVLDLAMG